MNETTNTNGSIAPVDVLILMGSDSDWSAMEKCHDLLNTLEISHDITVASAHRTPAKVHHIAATANDRGVKVVIAAAGMAAHLAGTLAALVDCPVIGVPMSGGMMDGLDALLSTVQMPPGVPVATVGVGSAGAKNAAILATQMIALTDAEAAGRLKQWRTDQIDVVNAKDRSLRQKIGLPTTD